MLGEKPHLLEFLKFGDRLTFFHSLELKEYSGVITELAWVERHYVATIQCDDGLLRDINLAYAPPAERKKRCRKHN